MFARISSLFLFVLFAVPILAAATAVPRNSSPPTTPASQCNTGDLQCCNSVQSSTSLSDPVTALLVGLGVVIGSLTGDVGVTCTSILGGDSCSAQAVCCSNNSFNGLVSLGCSPVDLGL